MKVIFFSIFFSIILFTSCKKENNTPATILNETLDSNAKAKYSGVFANGPYGAVSGSAKIFFKNGKFSLLLDSVNITNGPDLHVYLSNELMPVNFIDLGKLKSVNGSQIYEINGTPDFGMIKYVLIHCQLFDHLFGSAGIK